MAIMKRRKLAVVPNRRVEAFNLKGPELQVQITDEHGQSKQVPINRQKLKIILAVGAIDAPTLELYADVRQEPKGVAYALPHKVIYLGKASRERFLWMTDYLDQRRIDWMPFVRPASELEPTTVPTLDH